MPAIIRLPDLFPGNEGLLEARVFLLLLQTILIRVGSAGLVYYLLYLYTGKKWIAWPIGAYSLLVLTWHLATLQAAEVVGYGVGCPNQEFCYAQRADDTLLRWSQIGPNLAAALVYALLYFRVQHPVQRRRVALVSASLALLFGARLVATTIRGDFETAQGTVAHMALTQSPYWVAIINPAIGLAAGLVCWWAYRLRASPTLTGGSVPG